MAEFSLSRSVKTTKHDRKELRIITVANLKLRKISLNNILLVVKGW
jgi:hypothetical protein